MKYSSKTDGIDHINVYSKGKTSLGRSLTNFSYSPFKCEDGHFDSIEGYWYWLSCKDEALRTLSGFQAKKYGRSVRALDWVDDPDFRDKICKAIVIKITNSETIMSEMITSTLPFVHYYEYKNKVVSCHEAYWIMELLEDIRSELKKRK